MSSAPAASGAKSAEEEAAARLREEAEADVRRAFQTIAPTVMASATSASPSQVRSHGRPSAWRPASQAAASAVAPTAISPAPRPR